MNRHYDRYLTKKYPILFKNRYAPVTHSGMGFGFDCGSGWFHLINKLCRAITHHVNSSRSNRAKALVYNRALNRWIKYGDDSAIRRNFTFGGKPAEDLIQKVKTDLKPRFVPEACNPVIVDQVKEKFGTLRFYYHGGDDYVDGLVSMAEYMSSIICEQCGNVGKLSTDGWCNVRCKIHKE